jgi:HAE1 family hydrophobic/amphiphilic exporter-1
MLDPYMPIQNMDVLTILGFVILAGVVVNNAILIVHQSLNFLRQGETDLVKAIRMGVESRVRPIAMSTLTSVGGMLPLVLMPGSGSELYRGLGAVVVGGLLVSTFFTLILVPILLHALLRLGGRPSPDGPSGEPSSAPLAEGGLS